MLQEEITNGIVSVIKSIFYVLVWQFVLFNVGRITLLLVTVGRYPKGRLVELHVNRISLVGLAVLFTAWSAVAIHNNLYPWHSYA
jgi:hypothetical protein